MQSGTGVTLAQGKISPFFDYLVEEAFKAADKEGQGYLTLEQIRETLVEVSVELKGIKPNLKDIDRALAVFSNITEKGVSLTEFKVAMKEVLHKLYYHHVH